MKLTKTLGHLGLITSTLVEVNKYFSHYLPEILGNSDNYKFFKFVPLENLTSRKTTLRGSLRMQIRVVQIPQYELS